MEKWLWTKVECLCGRTAAIPEAGYFPLCGQCGRRMTAPPGMAAREIFEGPAPVRALSDETLRADLERRGFPVEAQPWPRVDPGDGHRLGMPPWEIA